jgi:hypothetical protein
MPELLKEIAEVGKVAIVAETGVIATGAEYANSDLVEVLLLA